MHGSYEDTPLTVVVNRQHKDDILIVFSVEWSKAPIDLNPDCPTDCGGVDGHDGADPGGLMAEGLRSIDVVPHEVQRQRGTQGLLVQRETMVSHYSWAAD